MRLQSFYIQTLGCKVNQYESQVIRERFLQQGCVESKTLAEADICVVNTCTVTSTSDAKSLKLIGKCLRFQNKCVIATGCMVEDSQLDLSKLKGVNFIIKNKDKYSIPEIIEGTPGHQVTRSPVAISGLKDHTRVFVKIQDGCDNMCSYCKVCIIRGRSRSRPFKEIIEECAGLIKNGTKEIVLTGICLGAYGRDMSKDINLTVLIRELCRAEGEWRLRLSSIEPKDIRDGLIKELASQEKFCKHLHIPFQSGDDYILKKMNRPYTSRDYKDIVHTLRSAVPDIAISTDIMVGFPGETEEHFQNTVNFIKDIKPMRVHIFPFSKRIGTKAYYYKDAVDTAVKREREAMLLSLVKELSHEFIAMFLGKKAEVLIEGKHSSDGYLNGYTDRYIKVYIKGPDTLKSTMLRCQLTLTPPLLLGKKQGKARAGLTNQKVYGILLS